MTVLVGILCEDGVVVGSDSSATSAHGPMPLIEQKVGRKVEVIGNDVIVAGTGQVGLGQRFNDIVRDYRVPAGGNFAKKKPVEIVKYVAGETIKDFASTFAPKGKFGALMAFPSSEGPQLCEFATEDFQPELKTTKHLWYVSMGSGQPITDPFLGLIRRVFWKDGKLPRLNEAIFAAAWALEHTILLNPGGINGPLQMAVLSRPGPNQAATARLLGDDELLEHMDSVRGAEKHLAAYATTMANAAASKVAPRPPNAPGVPKP